MSAQAKKSCAAILGRAQVGEPFRSPENDVGDAGEGFGVIDDGRPPPQSDHSREGTTNTLHSALALQRFHKRGFFADFVRACAALPVNFEISPAAKYIFSEEPLRVGIRDCFLHDL